MASSGSRDGSMPNSKLLAAAATPDPDASPSGPPPGMSSRSIGEERMISESMSGPGAIVTK